MNRLAVAVVLGQLVAQLGWVDPIYIPLILAGPLVTGALAASRRFQVAWPAVLWFSAGINMLVLDWVVNGEDVAYHAVLSIVMAALALLGWAVTWMATRWRRADTTSVA